MHIIIKIFYLFTLSARSFSQIFIFVPLHITFSWFAFQYAEVFLYFEFEYDMHHVDEPYTCYTIST